MRDDLGREVAAMLNIEAGAPLYSYEADLSAVVRSDAPKSNVTVSGYERVLVACGPGHPKGFRFRWRETSPPNERFNWGAIHRRVEKLLAERAS